MQIAFNICVDKKVYKVRIFPRQGCVHIYQYVDISEKETEEKGKLEPIVKILHQEHE